MDDVLGSNVGSIAVPLAAGGISSMGPRSTAGVRTGLAGANMAMRAQMQREEAQQQQRIQELFSSAIEPTGSQSSDAASVPATPGDADQIGSVRNLALRYGARSGDASTVFSTLTRLKDISDKWDQPMKVHGSLMSREGDVLGSAPVRAPFRSGAGGTYSTVTGSMTESPATEAKTAQGGQIADARVKDYLGKTDLSGSRAKQAEAAAESHRARVKLIEVQINQAIKSLEEGTDPKGNRMSRENRLKVLHELMSNPDVQENPEQMKRLSYIATSLELEMAGPDYDATDEGSDNPDAVDAAVPSHETKKKGKVLYYDPNSGGVR